MKILKIVTSFIIVSAIVFLSLSCSSTASVASTAKNITATVKEGSISVTITGTGNLAYSHSEDLAFEMPGYVEEVSVSAGDTVTKGQELARVDTTDWEKQVRAEERAVAAAQRTLSNKQDALSAAQRQVASKELDVNQKELDVQIAQYALTQVDDVKTAQTKVDSAQQSRDLVLAQLQVAQVAGKDTDALDQQLVHFSTLLDEAQKDLDRVLKGLSINVTSSVALQIAQLQMTINQKQQTLTDAQNAVETARTAVKNAQLDVNDAEQDVKDAQSDLEETQSLNAVIKAPFDGFITKVGISGGAEVYKGSVAVQIADPNKFEANILITENDITSVKLGGEATVSLDAISDATFPAKITEIAPTATISSGVVNYKVTVELTSLQATGATSSQSINLKDGLSATVRIVSQRKDNILIIPSRAITRQGQNYTVQVVEGTGTQTRSVKTGITDGTNTEISEGLSQGEQIVYKVGSTSSTQTNTQGMPGMQGAGGPPPGF